MYVYRMETRDQDKAFLAGTPVVCRAVIELNDALHAGDFILVELSNRKKYKGKIVEFRSFAVDKYIAGDLTIIRV